MGDNIPSKYILLINEYDYLSKQLKSAIEIRDVANQRFKNDLQQLLNKKAGKDIYQQKSPPIISATTNSEEINPLPVEDNDTPILYKKLFRKIVIKCHPDKIKEKKGVEESIDYLNLYRDTVDSYNKKNFYFLLVVAIKLNIEIGELKKDIPQITQHSEEMRKEIENIKNTYSFLYFMEEDDNSNLLESYYNKFFKD